MACLNSRLSARIDTPLSILANRQCTDLIIDSKGSGTGHVVGLWDGLFNPENYTNGSVCFTHDDHLVELLNAAKADASTENMKAFNDYIIDNAIVPVFCCKASLPEGLLQGNAFP